MRFVPLFLSSILHLFITNLVISQDWELKKDADGIKVYTRSIEGYKLKEFKGVVSLNAKIETIEAALRDVKNHPEWIANCEEAEILENRGNELIVYSVTGAPFPVSDRDNVAEFTFKQEGNDIRVTLDGNPNHIPAKENYVRIPFLKGHWLLEPLSDGKTQVTYQVHADPGGSIPTWLANSTAVDNPFETLEGLRDYLEETY